MRHTTFAALILCLGMAGCAGEPAAREETGGVIIGIDWYLLEIVVPEKVIDLNRSGLETEGMGDVFTLRFEGENRVGGKAAPNRYTAPCSWGDDNTIAIGTTAATMMAAFKEPEALKEREFFNYLGQVKRWEVKNGRLELYTAPDKNGRRTTLVFVKNPEKY